MPDTNMVDRAAVHSAVAASQPGFAWMMLPRHGRRPLGFEGRLLLRAASQPPALPLWTEIAVHEAASGPLVAGIRHLPRDADGTASGDPFCYAVAQPDVDALLDWLAAHDPVADLPSDLLLADRSPGDALRTAAALRAGWQALLNATFGGAAASTASADIPAGEA